MTDQSEKVNRTLDSHEEDVIDSYRRGTEEIINEQQENDVDSRRPQRVIIALIDKCPKELISTISPSTLRLKQNLKVPLVLLCWSAGIMNGEALVFLKIGGEVINSDEFSKNIIFAFLIAALGVASAGFQIYLLNVSMRLYTNLDVMPIY